VEGEHAPVGGDLDEIQLGVEDLDAVARELEVAEPRRGRDPAQEDRVGVVADVRQQRVGVAHERSARSVETLDGENLQPRPAEIGLEDEAVVTGAQDDPVVLVGRVVYLQSKNSLVT
jgi:hypothetical protein